MHRRFNHSILCVAFMLGVSVSLVRAESPPPRSAALHQLFKDYWEHHLRTSPEQATYLGDHRYSDKLTDYSDAARAEDLAFQEAMRARLMLIDRDALSPSDQLNWDLFERELDEFIELAPFPSELMPIKQQGSPQIELGMLQTTHRFESPEDVRMYAARLSAFPRQVMQLIDLMDRGVAAGVVRPKITIEKALEQMDAMIVDDPTKCPLYAPAETLPETAGGEKSKTLILGATRVAMRGVETLRDYLRDKYLPACRDTVGYCELPNGKAWYRRLAKHHTTTDLTPEEIHQIGLDELKRIHAEMRAIAREVGFDGELQDFMEKLRNDPAQHNTLGEDMLRRHREILARSDANLPKLFGRLPKTPYGVKPIEAFRAPAAPTAYYYPAPDDGSRTAYFYVNIYQPETRPIYTMEALAYHEAMPGHHLQISLSQERKDLPDFRRFGGITAFVEGWGLYSELLGYELGGYQDPYSRFGQLTYQTWRASRLVVDTGMHYYGWSRQQAIDFMKANTALSEQNITSEVDRYIAWPGQALAYMIGKIEIVKLRREAEAKLGDRFDIRVFHDHLLEESSLPLTILRERMEAWMAEQSHGKSD